MYKTAEATPPPEQIHCDTHWCEAIVTHYPKQTGYRCIYCGWFRCIYNGCRHGERVWSFFKVHLESKHSNLPLDKCRMCGDPKPRDKSGGVGCCPTCRVFWCMHEDCQYETFEAKMDTHIAACHPEG